VSQALSQYKTKCLSNKGVMFNTFNGGFGPLFLPMTNDEKMTPILSYIFIEYNSLSRIWRKISSLRHFPSVYAVLNVTCFVTNRH